MLSEQTILNFFTQSLLLVNKIERAGVIFLEVKRDVRWIYVRRRKQRWDISFYCGAQTFLQSGDVINMVDSQVTVSRKLANPDIC